MSKDIWHTADEAPKPYEDIAFYVDGYLYFSSYHPQYNQYGIFGADKVEKWCYVKELSSYIPALETENKDLSDKIGKLKAELDRTRKALDDAKKWLMKIGYLNMSDHGLGSEKMMTDWCKTVALHGLKEIETALEQKD